MRIAEIKVREEAREAPPGFDDLKCCTGSEYAIWRAQAYKSPPAAKVGFCEDCTPEYARQMREAGRCCRPKVKFYKQAAEVWQRGETDETVGFVTSKGEVYGAHKPNKTTFRDIRSGETMTVVDVEVENSEQSIVD